MTGIGIVGAGISGLVLALRLQQLGVGATLYSEHDPDGLRGGRLPNTVGRAGHTQARERELGSEHFRDPGAIMPSASLSIKGDPPLEFTGSFGEPFHAVDFRLLVPALMDDFAGRGGEIVVTGTPPDAARIDRWSRRHELMVVTAGRRSVAELFPRDPGRCPYDRPQRLLAAGLYRGLDGMGRTFSFNISGGVGEIFRAPFVTREGVASALILEAVPGGPLEPVTRMPWDEVPAALLALFREHTPRLAEAVDAAAFELLGPDDLLQGAITPTVRRPVAELPSGRIALAVGDAWIVNDPITGQGANLGSACAWIAADAIAAGGPYDAAFGRATAERMWEVGGPVTNWTNAFLQPPAEHVMRLMAAATTRQDIADVMAGLFSDPRSAWALLSSPEAVARIVDGGEERLYDRV
ncbi:monooxygenase [Nonomuraea sp. MG754425]|uniref:styrene monooxygenase/indole monooxygenase family protein n=1 Tax=Nonomuraea sp. MG754425 TaxID=2570319 RepID=UPI001F3DF455|nr:styrene monooxygenase/indole monooxygenase family protein [Nonomuraea sp. MG754425]MCF6469556.1 monooxygenase [Nonomuraea sp. MG754425]